MMKARMLFGPVRAYNTKKYGRNVTNKKVPNPRIQIKKSNEEVPIPKIEITNSNTRVSNPGIQNRLQMYEDNEVIAEIGASHDFHDLHEDVDQYESDFLNAGKSHKMHEKEMEFKKIKLKNQITYSKYLKEVEPSFLTFAEKELIKSLHESDPHQWSVENLSDSFPALPQTIKKVLHAKWSPKSVDTVLRYDEKVMMNWEAFREGEIALSPELRKHLENFKDRKIILTDREKLAKRFVPPKIEFPKPKSKLFSSIAKTFLLPSMGTQVISSDSTDVEITEDKNIEVDDRFVDVESEEYSCDVQNNFQFKKNSYETIEDSTYGNSNFQYKKNNSYEDFKGRKNFKTMKDFNMKNNRNDFQFNENSIHQNFDTTRDFDDNQNNDCRFEKNNDHHNFEARQSFQDVRSLTIQNRKQTTELISSKQKNYNKTKQSENLLTFEGFLKEKVGQTKNSSSPEDIVLKETYKRHIEKTALFESMSPVERQTSTEIENAETVTTSKVSRIERKNEISSSNQKLQTDQISRSNNHELSLSSTLESQTDQILSLDDCELSLGLGKSDVDTYVKVWHKKDEDEDFPDFITIPKHKYQQGMTYKVRNCYYDDDGEFLYKVPGLRN